MSAIKCDRCTKFFEPYKPKMTTKYSNMLISAEDRGNRFVDWRRYQLCEDCMKDACRFMTAKIS